jgi:hypothetical protein
VKPALPRRERDAGGTDDLVGPHQTLPVSGEEVLRAGRVELRQPLAERYTAQAAMEIDGLVPDLFGNFRNRGQTSLYCTEVKAGAADENRQPPRSRRQRDLVECQRKPVSD